MLKKEMEWSMVAILLNWEDIWSGEERLGRAGRSEFGVRGGKRRGGQGEEEWEEGDEEREGEEKGEGAGG